MTVRTKVTQEKQLITVFPLCVTKQSRDVALNHTGQPRDQGSTQVGLGVGNGSHTGDGTPESGSTQNTRIMSARSSAT